VLSEIPVICRKLSRSQTEQYPVGNGTIRIKKEIVSKQVNFRRITPFNEYNNLI
jgi:hypothetical protein